MFVAGTEGVANPVAAVFAVGHVDKTNTLFGNKIIQCIVESAGNILTGIQRTEGIEISGHDKQTVAPGAVNTGTIVITKFAIARGAVAARHRHLEYQLPVIIRW